MGNAIVDCEDFFVPENFADTAGDIDLAAGLVRIELMTRAMAGDPGPGLRLDRRLVMPLDGFHALVAAMNGLAAKLTMPPAPKPPPAEVPAAQPRSPNFGR